MSDEGRRSIVKRAGRRNSSDEEGIWFHVLLRGRFSPVCFFSLDVFEGLIDR